MPGMITESGITGLGWCTWYSGMRSNCNRCALPRSRCLTIGWEWCNRKDLAGHRNLGARVSECLVEDALTLTHPVYLGRIEQRDPKSRARCTMSRAKPEA